MGAAHTVHVDGCRDITFAVRTDRSGLCTALRLKADSLEAALVEAQYQGLEPDEASDLGDVDVAPCATRAGR